MSFKVLIETGDPDNPHEVIHEISDKRVTRVGLTSATGEVGAARVEPTQTEVLLTFEYVHKDGRPTLADVESMLHPTRTGDEADTKISELNELPSATNTGIDHISNPVAEETGETPEESDSSGGESAPPEGDKSSESGEPFSLAGDKEPDA